MHKSEAYTPKSAKKTEQNKIRDHSSYVRTHTTKTNMLHKMHEADINGLRDELRLKA